MSKITEELEARVSVPGPCGLEYARHPVKTLVCGFCASSLDLHNTLIVEARIPRGQRSKRERGQRVTLHCYVDERGLTRSFKRITSARDWNSLSVILPGIDFDRI
mmetsp:Transcript_764/g.1612  ORF Transcript_764/g.1612 Transcript_764/m.1612 type:complete len:105 (-) Transcript_764:1758-2072(-)